jgi:hypothetical protein
MTPRRATFRHIAYACKILVTDAIGKRVLMNVGKGGNRDERESAVFQEVFGDVDFDVLHGFLENTWWREFRDGDAFERPTAGTLANVFWTCFFRFVYRHKKDFFFSRHGMLIDVPSMLVLSGGKVGTRRTVDEAFFTKNRISRKTIQLAFKKLLRDEDKTLTRSWFKENGWEKADPHSGRGTVETPPPENSSSIESYSESTVSTLFQVPEYPPDNYEELAIPFDNPFDTPRAWR